MAGEDVRELLIRVNASTELLRSNLTAAERAVADFERDTNRRLDRIDGNFGKLGAGLDRLKVGFASASGAAAGFIGAIGVGSVIAAGQAVLNFADNLDAAAQQAGVTVERYQTLKEGLRALEVSGEQTDKILKTLTDTLGSVQSGTASKSMTEALDRLGVTQDILNGKISDSGELLDAIAKGSKNYATEAQFTSDVVALLGRKIGVDLAAAIKDGGTALRGMEEDFRSTGHVITEEMVTKLADANEAIDAFKTRSAQTLTIWAGETLDYFSHVADGLARLELRYRNFLGADTGDLQSRIDEYTNSQATPAGIRAQEDRVRSAQQQANNARSVSDFFGGGGLIGQGAQWSANRNLQEERDRLTGMTDARRRRVVGDLWGNWGSLGGNSLPEPQTFAPPKTDPKNPRSGTKKSEQDLMGEMLDRVDIGVRNTRIDFEDEIDDRLRDQIKVAEDGWQKVIAVRKEGEAEISRRQEDQIQSLQRMFEDGFHGGTEAIWKNFESLGISVISRVLAEFAASAGGGGGFNLGKSFSGAISSALGFGGFFAEGGSPPVGKISVVGERGPELFVPKVPGTIIPNGGGGGGTAVSLTINAPGATAETIMMIRRELANAAPMIIQAANQNTMRTMGRRRLG